MPRPYHCGKFLIVPRVAPGPNTLTSALLKQVHAGLVGAFVLSTVTY